MRITVATKITVWQCDTEDVPPYVGTIGQVLLRQGDRLLVQARDQPVWISDLETASGPVKCGSFRVGSKFGFAVHRRTRSVAR